MGDEPVRACPTCGIDTEPYLKGIWEGWRRCLESMHGNSQIGNSLYTLVALALAKTSLPPETRKIVYRAVQDTKIPEIFGARENQDQDGLVPVIRLVNTARGESHPNAKITRETVQWIRDEVKKAQRSWISIIREAGLSEAAGYDIIKNRTWHDPSYTQPPQGVNNSRGRPQALTQEKVDWLRRDFQKEPKTADHYAEALETTKQTVYRVLGNTTWHDPNYKPKRDKRGRLIMPPRPSSSPRRNGQPTETSSLSAAKT